MTEQRQKSGLRGILVTLWRGFDLARRAALNLLFLLVILFVWAAIAGGGPPEVPETAVLVVAPKGVIVEQLSGDPVDRAVQKLTDSEVPETLLQDLLDAIEAGKDDDRIRVLLLDLDAMNGAGLTKLRDLRAAIEDFKTSGKPVIAEASAYNMARYHLAAAADEIYVHPLGAVVIEGYGRYRTYYKEGLDRYGIDWNVIRVGTFKSAVEPYLRDDMSDEAKMVNRAWLGELWDGYLDDVASARGLEVSDVAAAIEEFNERLAQAEGDTARMALELGWVDQVAHPDAVRARLVEIAGEDEDSHSYPRISHSDYLEARGETFDFGGDAVAVVVARGTILPGQQPSGAIGGDSTAKLIRQARHDDDVKAVVLRVDSGGGSAFASEVIRRELALVREAGKPVVVSMGSVAASGGYWISTASDEIWASPVTITGSIGIFGYFPTFQNAMRKYLGMRVDGVGTTWLAGVRPDRELPPEALRALELIIGDGYRDFLERVAEARGMDVDQVDAIGQGRVWSGAQAHERGLVDQLGGLSDAVASAAERAGLGEDYRVLTIEKELGFDELMAIEMMSRAEALGITLRMPGSPGGGRSTGSTAFTRALERILSQPLETFALFEDPMGIYAHCLCEL